MSDFNWTETLYLNPGNIYINGLQSFFSPSQRIESNAKSNFKNTHTHTEHIFYFGDPHVVLTWYCGSWVRRLSSLNSSWMLVTSASVLSDVHRGGWAVPFPMLTSEKGIFDGVLKAGISLDPRSFFKWTERTARTELYGQHCKWIEAEEALWIKGNSSTLQCSLQISYKGYVLVHVNLMSQKTYSSRLHDHFNCTALKTGTKDVCYGLTHCFL